MIDDRDIAKAIGQRLLTLDPAYPVAWPGDDIDSLPHPFLIVQHVPVSRTDDTLQGGVEIVTGFVQVTVMTEPDLPIWSDTVRNANGQIVQSAGAIASAIRALFPYTLRLPINGGEVTVTQPSKADEGYPDSPHWRTPVKITYEAS